MKWNLKRFLCNLSNFSVCQFLSLGVDTLSLNLHIIIIYTCHVREGKLSLVLINTISGQIHPVYKISKHSLKNNIKTWFRYGNQNLYATYFSDKVGIVLLITIWPYRHTSVETQVTLSKFCFFLEMYIILPHRLFFFIKEILLVDV